MSDRLAVDSISHCPTGTHHHKPMFLWHEMSVSEISHRYQHSSPGPFTSRHPLAVEEMMSWNDVFARLGQRFGEQCMNLERCWRWSRGQWEGWIEDRWTRLWCIRRSKLAIRIVFHGDGWGRDSWMATYYMLRLISSATMVWLE